MHDIDAGEAARLHWAQVVAFEPAGKITKEEGSTSTHDANESITSWMCAGCARSWCMRHELWRGVRRSGNWVFMPSRPYAVMRGQHDSFANQVSLTHHALGEVGVAWRRVLELVGLWGKACLGMSGHGRNRWAWQTEVFKGKEGARVRASS